MRPPRIHRGTRAFPLAILFFVPSAQAGVIEYVAPGGSIQAAIDRVENDGTVHVAAGEYDECLTIPRGRLVTVLALDGADETTIRCSFGDRAVSVEGSLSMRGFTLTHTGFGGGGINVEGTFVGQDLVFADMLDSTAPGAGIRVFDGIATLIDATFDQLNTTADGGAMAVDEDGILTVLGATVTRTSAAGNGGAVYVRDGRFTAVGLDIDGTLSPISARYGGGLYAATTADVSLFDSSIEGATASLDGGGLYIEERSGTVTGTALRLEGNSAVRDGGGGYVAGPLVLRNSVVTLNDAAEGGGGLTVEGGSATLYATEISDNTAGGEPSAGGWPSGAGLYVDGGDLATADCTIIDNVATSGDALGGGAYVVDRAEWSSVGDIISGNVARDGGGAYIDGVSALAILQSVISENSAIGGSGGGLYIDGGESINELENTLIEANTADTGGGLYVVDDTTLIVEGWNVVGNEAVVGDGGGLWLGDGVTFDCERCRITGNTSLSGSGGGIRYAGTDEQGGLQLLYTHVADNVALGGADPSSGTGGGISMSEGTLSVTASWVYDNSSEDEGGGIYVTRGHDTQMYQTVLCGNEGSRGGGLFLDESFGTRRLANMAVHSNRARESGGAVFDGGYSEGAESRETSIQFSTIVSNEAADNASFAGVVVDTSAELDNDSEIVIEDSVFSANGAHHLAGDGDRAARVDTVGSVFYDSIGAAFNVESAIIGVDGNVFADPGIADGSLGVPDCLADDLRSLNSTSDGGRSLSGSGFGVGAGVSRAPSAIGSIFAELDGDGVQLAQGDCDPDERLVGPDVAETPANGIDDDCDLGDDYDRDGDGYLDSIGDYPGSDCAPVDPDANPGADEVWGAGGDQDCDGRDDNDEDGDGYDDGDDCDDRSAALSPLAIDIPYDGIDQNCDGANDSDADGDGSPIDAGDCDDRNPDINGGADEIWYDGIDQDCLGDDDFDQDADGFASSAFGGTDCDDLLAEINPSAPEIAYDGIDQDCSGGDLVDVDGDGFASDVVGGLDCDDTRDDVYPGAEELLDGDDNDCDGLGDPDSDGDGLLDYYEDLQGTDKFEADSDGDFIDDPTEWGADINNPIDTDGDGIIDALDEDSDNDTLEDGVETDLDADGDGIPNYRDPDDDNDGLSTQAEYNGGVDSDGDTTPDYLDSDSDNDGVADGSDPSPTDAGGSGEDPNVGTYTPEKYGFGCTTSGGGTGSSWLALGLGLLLLRRRD